MAWKQVRRFGVYLRDLDDVSRLWESEASVPRFNRSWKLDLKDEFGKGSRSPSLVEAVRVKRFVNEVNPWAAPPGARRGLQLTMVPTSASDLADTTAGTEEEVT